MTIHSANPMITEPLREEHRELMVHVEQIRAAARELPDLSPTERDVLVGRITTFVENTLAPHARTEEEVLYRVIGEILGQPRATEPMIHDHQLIRETAHLLAHTDAADVGITQELMYRLYGLIVAHFRKEEDLYLSILDAHPERALEVLGELRAAGHAHA
jgi:hemerythrin HHE cation binding domain-containing protein